MTDHKTNFLKNIQQSFSFGKAFLFLGTIYVVALFSVIRSNFNYVDDMERVLLGYADWETTFSRYASTWLSHLIHAGKFLTDISPLPQFLAIALLVLSSLLVIRAVTKCNSYSMIHLIAALPIGLSPYYLECLSYKYDAPYMALSILVSILPIFFAKKGPLINLIGAALGSFVMCITYQASSGVYPMLVILLSFIAWNQKEDLKKILPFILSSAGGYLIGLLIFRIFLVKPIVVDGSDYISASIAGPLQILRNYKRFLTVILSDFKKEWILLIGILMIVFFVTAIQTTKRKTWQAFLLSAVMLLLMAAICLGVYPFMTIPLTAPRAIYGVGIFTGFTAIYAVSASREYIGKICACILGWCFLVFALSYGNALYVQSQYTDYRIQVTIDDLKDLGYLDNETPKTALIKGSIEYAPAIENIPYDSAMLRRLIPVTYCEKWYWGLVGINSYYDLDCLNFVMSADFDETDFEILSDNIFETIYGDEEHIVIKLKP